MKIISHKVPGEEDQQHAAASIVEVTKWCLADRETEFDDITGKGFYFTDEIEVNMYGPHPTMEEAIRQRNLYFNELENEPGIENRRVLLADRPAYDAAMDEITISNPTGSN